MANKTLNTRIQHKTDTSANWAQAENFSPLKGEIIIYQEENENNSKIKVGDGNTNVNDLPFIAEQVQPDWNQNDSSASDFIKNKPFGESNGNQQIIVTEDDIDQSNTIYDEVNWLCWVQLTDMAPQKEDIVGTEFTFLDGVAYDYQTHTFTSATNIVEGKMYQLNNEVEYMGETNYPVYVVLEEGVEYLGTTWSKGIWSRYDDSMGTFVCGLNFTMNVNIVKTIEDKYIPDTIARKSEIPTVPTKVSELENDSNFVSCSDVTKVGGFPDAGMYDSQGNLLQAWDDIYQEAYDNSGFYWATGQEILVTPADLSIGIETEGWFSNLKQVILGEGTSLIALNGFSWSISPGSLKSIVVPTSVSSIWNGIEEYSLDTIYYMGTEEQWNQIEFYDKNEFNNYGFNIVFNYSIPFGGDSYSYGTIKDNENNIFYPKTKASIVEMSDGSTLDNILNDKMSKSGDTMTGQLNAPWIATGEDPNAYFQSRKFRGEGDANSYFHAVDFGYAGHDQVDFHEYGGVYNFYKNEEGTKDSGILVASIQPTYSKFIGDVQVNPDGNGVNYISLTDIFDRLQLLETLLANISYNAENNTYTFNANIIENPPITQTSCSVYIDNSWGMHYLEITYVQLNEDGSTESVTVEDPGTDGIGLPNVLCGSTIDIYNWTGSFDDGTTEKHITVGTESEQTFVIQ